MEGGRGREREKEEGEREGEREKRKKAKTTKKGEKGEEMLGAINKQEIEYVCVNHSLYKYHNSSSTECTN